MIDLYYWPTSNGHKIPLFLEEVGLPYEIKPINISKGDQFEPEFLKIAPNNRMPAIVDHTPADGGEPISIFESGAILLYLAEKTGKFIPSDVRGRKTVLEWLFWQMGGLGPMAGQRGHFKMHAAGKSEYALNRYQNETNRLQGVMDKRLAAHEFLAGDYSIADMACYPWINSSVVRYGDDISGFANLKRWYDTISERPATKAAYAIGEPYMSQRLPDDQAAKVLYGQTADSVAQLRKG